MARRVVTPELFEDEWFGSLEDRDQLVWIGLFAILADDQGRLLDNPILIRTHLWPYREVPASDISAALDHFTSDGRLHRYEADGRPLLQIVNWWRHQKPQWAMASAWPPPSGWGDRVRTRQNNEYVEDGWMEPGGFTCDAQVKCSGEDSHVDSSGEPLGLAHEPEAVPEPEQNPDPIPPTSLPSKAPVDNAALPRSGSVSIDTDNQAQGDAALEALGHNPTCGGSECPVRSLRVDIRGVFAQTVGPGDAGKLYNPETPHHKALAGMAGYICAACWKASADPGVTMADRQPICRRALVGFVQGVAAFHVRQPIRSLPGFLRTRYENMTEAPVPDELLAELRKLERLPRRDGATAPKRIDEILRGALPPARDGSS